MKFSLSIVLFTTVLVFLIPLSVTLAFLATLVVFLAIRNNEEKLLMVMLCGIWMVVVYAHMLNFSFFDQALFLLDRGVTPWTLFQIGHIWAPRYLTAYPSVWIAHALGWTLDQAYTLYGGAFLALQAFFLVKIADLCWKPYGIIFGHKLILGLVFSAYAFGAGMFMNGRLAPAHLGMILILWAQVHALERGVLSLGTFLIQALGFFLSMMSSGTMMVAFAQMLLSPLFLKKTRWRSLLLRRMFLPLAGLILLGCLFYVRKGIRKSLKFWHGVLPMLEHGMGEWLRKDLFVTILLLLLGVTAIAAYSSLGKRVYNWNPSLSPMLINLPVAVLCGLFGYSTLSMGFPAMAILAVVTAPLALHHLARFCEVLCSDLKRPRSVLSGRQSD